LRAGEIRSVAAAAIDSRTAPGKPGAAEGHRYYSCSYADDYGETAATVSEAVANAFEKQKALAKEGFPCDAER